MESYTLTLWSGSPRVAWPRRGALLPKPTAPLLPLTMSALAPTSQDWHPERGVCVVAMTAETPAVWGVSRRPGEATLWPLWLGERRLVGHRPSSLRLSAFPVVFTQGQVYTAQPAESHHPLLTELHPQLSLPRSARAAETTVCTTPCTAARTHTHTLTCAPMSTQAHTLKDRSHGSLQKFLQI